MKKDNEILSVTDLFSKITELRERCERHAHLRIWFRGHSKSGWPLIPGVYRPAFVAEREGEAERLLKERHLFQDFRVFSANLRTGNESDEDLYFLQQHYRMPTRLLDWSTNPLAALYFVVCDQNLNNEPGELFMMDAYHLSLTQNASEAEFRGIVTSRHKMIHDSVHRISNWRDDKKFPPFIMGVRPGHFDDRIFRQHSYFTFHVPDHPKLTIKENSTLRSFRIPGGGGKLKLKEELSLLAVNDFTVFGDLDHLADWLKSAHA
jgi:hypothetical protein